MLKPEIFKYLVTALVAGSVFGLDQISKEYIDQAFHLHESLPVIPDFFSITYVRNRGAAFGLFAHQGPLFRTILFSLVSLIALVSIGWMIYQTPRAHWGTLTGLSLLLGGAIGNTADRVRMGEVIDFLDFYIGPHHWPAFNVADSAITLGVAGLVLQLIWPPPPLPAHEEREPTAPTGNGSGKIIET